MARIALLTTLLLFFSSLGVQSQPLGAVASDSVDEWVEWQQDDAPAEGQGQQGETGTGHARTLLTGAKHRVVWRSGKSRAHGAAGTLPPL
jgi:hypothetical protein